MNSQTEQIGEQAEDSAGVRFPPPFIYGLAVLAGIGLNILWPMTTEIENAWRIVGIALMAVSFFLAASGFRALAKGNTTVNPNGSTSQIVTTGPYAFTRNPLYLALALLQTGLGFTLANGWILLLIIPAVAIIRFYVIRREEAYLVRAFGEQYNSYRKSVRRWI